MDMEFSPEDLAFQKEVRDFIAENYPAELRGKQDEGDELTKEDFLAWHKILYKKGWVAPAWPVEYGGTGWDPIKRYIFDQEMNAAGAPPPIAFAFSMVGPVLYTFANQAQKDHFLPRILSGEEFWCQGFSEPGSGSDLASLRTSARREGEGEDEHYVVDGQKIWTTTAHLADWVFALVRTDGTGSKQHGISFLLIDLKSPGITVRPIRSIDGTNHVNEVFFEEVKVPASQLVGEENQGWE
mgnify:CR=1 FL=1